MTLPPAPTRPSNWRMLWNAVRRRCPRCGARDVWTSFMRTRTQCPNCGLELERGESDYFYGAVMLNIIAAELVPVIVFVIWLIIAWPDPPWNLITAVTVVLAVVAPIALYPTTKALWLALDLMFRPQST